MVCNIGLSHADFVVHVTIELVVARKLHSYFTLRSTLGMTLDFDADPVVCCNTITYVLIVFWSILGLKTCYMAVAMNVNIEDPNIIQLIWNVYSMYTTVNTVALDLLFS